MIAYSKTQRFKLILTWYNCCSTTWRKLWLESKSYCFFKTEMNNFMEFAENHWIWTGTSRISRYQFMDEFGETFTDFEFSEKIGSKESVRNIAHDIGQDPR